MKDLVILKDKQAVTTSRIIADYFGKEHKYVLRTIRELSEDDAEVGECYLPTSYLDSQSKTQSMYEINRDGFMYLAMYFRDDKAKKLKKDIVKAFNAMEEKLKNAPMTQTQLILAQAQRLVEQEKKLLEHDNRLKVIEAKVEGQGSNTNFYSILAYCKLKGFKLPISKTRELGIKARKLSNSLGIQIGKVPDERFGKVNSYAIEVIEEILAEDL